MPASSQPAAAYPFGRTGQITWSGVVERTFIRFVSRRSCLCEGIRQHRVDLVNLHEKAVVALLRANDLQVDAERSGGAVDIAWKRSWPRRPRRNVWCCAPRSCWRRGEAKRDDRSRPGCLRGHRSTAGVPSRR
ncbi:MAG: hypothetical protein LC749_12865 [Actinobacteria bacterium]|nr:hypothetical protein [Actinomycetota bacterium]